MLLGELWEGREYSLVLTARPGEYRCLPAAVLRGGCTSCTTPPPASRSPCLRRCRAGEVLRVAGFNKQCPVVEPVRR